MILPLFKDGGSGECAEQRDAHRFAASALDAGKDIELFSVYIFRPHNDAFSRGNIMSIILPRLHERGEIQGNFGQVLSGIEGRQCAKASGCGFGAVEGEQDQRGEGHHCLAVRRLCLAEAVGSVRSVTIGLILQWHTGGGDFCSSEKCRERLQC